MNAVKVDNTRDVIVKKIFTSTDAGLKYLALIVCKLLKIPFENFEFTLGYPEVSVNENVVDSKTDLFIQNDTIVVNVEINNQKKRTNRNKNYMYICQLILRQIKDQEIYSKPLKKVYQINLNSFDVSRDGRFIVRSKLLDEETHEEIHKLLEIIDVNLAKLSNLDYTIVKEDKGSLENLLYLFASNDKEKIKEVYDGDDLMNKIIDEIKSQGDDFDKLLFYNSESIEKGDSEAEAFEDGEESGKKSMILEMLRRNYDIDEIASISKLPREKIEEFRYKL